MLFERKIKKVVKKKAAETIPENGIENMSEETGKSNSVEQEQKPPKPVAENIASEQHIAETAPQATAKAKIQNALRVFPDPP